METEPQKADETVLGLDDADVKLLLGQAEVEKAVLRKNVNILQQKMSGLIKENEILKDALEQKGIVIK